MQVSYFSKKIYVIGLYIINKKLRIEKSSLTQ